MHSLGTYIFKWGNNTHLKVSFIFVFKRCEPRRHLVLSDMREVIEFYLAQCVSKFERMGERQHKFSSVRL